MNLYKEGGLELITGSSAVGRQVEECFYDVIGRILAGDSRERSIRTDRLKFRFLAEGSTINNKCRTLVE